MTTDTFLNKMSAIFYKKNSFFCFRMKGVNLNTYLLQFSNKQIRSMSIYYVFLSNLDTFINNHELNQKIITCCLMLMFRCYQFCIKSHRSLDYKFKSSHGRVIHNKKYNIKNIFQSRHFVYNIHI